MYGYKINSYLQGWELLFRMSLNNQIYVFYFQPISLPIFDVILPGPHMRQLKLMLILMWLILDFQRHNHHGSCSQMLSAIFSWFFVVFVCRYPQRPTRCSTFKRVKLIHKWLQKKAHQIYQVIFCWYPLFHANIWHLTLFHFYFNYRPTKVFSTMLFTKGVVTTSLEFVPKHPMDMILICHWVASYEPVPTDTNKNQHTKRRDTAMKTWRHFTKYEQSWQLQKLHFCTKCVANW